MGDRQLNFLGQPLFYIRGHWLMLWEALSHSLSHELDPI